MADEAGWRADPNAAFTSSDISTEPRSPATVERPGTASTDVFEAADAVPVTETVPPDTRTRRRWPWIVGIVAALVVGISPSGLSASQQKVDDLQAKLDRAQHAAPRRRRCPFTTARPFGALTRRRLLRPAPVSRMAEKQRQAKAAKELAAAATKAKKAADVQAAKVAADAARAAAGGCRCLRRLHRRSRLQCRRSTVTVCTRSAQTRSPAGIGPTALPVATTPSSTRPDTSDIATNDNVDGIRYVDLPAGKFFETTRCAAWHKL